MRGLCLILPALIASSHAFADAPAPAQSATVAVNLTAEQLVVVHQSMAIAAGQCATNAVGCQIGERIPAIDDKLNAAMKELQGLSKK